MSTSLEKPIRVVSLLATDFYMDNRVERMSQTISEMGYEVHIVAWLKNNRKEREVQGNVQVHRIRTRTSTWKRANKLIGLIQYLNYVWCAIAAYRKFEIWHCNDFEAFFIGVFAKISRPKLKLVYDSHEFQSERLGTPWYVRRVILIFEKCFISWTKAVITVSPSIQRIYSERNKREVYLVRNTPPMMEVKSTDVFRKQFGIRADQRICLYQGSLVPGRGIELLVEGFLKRKSDDAVLVIMGNGKLSGYVDAACEKSPIIFHQGFVPFHEISEYTSSADIGLNMAINNCLNHTYCLPNKIFEYVQCEIPVLTNDLVDCVNLVNDYGIGVVLKEYTEDGLNEAVDAWMKIDQSELKSHVKVAKQQLHWANEEKVLQRVYSSLANN